MEGVTQVAQQPFYPKETLKVLTKTRRVGRSFEQIMLFWPDFRWIMLRLVAQVGPEVPALGDGRTMLAYLVDEAGAEIQDRDIAREDIRAYLRAPVERVMRRLPQLYRIGVWGPDEELWLPEEETYLTWQTRVGQPQAIKRLEKTRDPDGCRVRRLQRNILQEFWDQWPNRMPSDPA